jgi:hypothetical protein
MAVEIPRMKPDTAAIAIHGESIPPASSVSVAPIPIGDGWSAELSPLPGGALLRVGRDATDRSMEIVISLTSDGPVLRARAASFEIEAQKDLVVRCERFRVEARESVEMVSGGTLQAQGRRIAVEATHGSARVVANDDVQLLGENVLLNCEHPQPSMPGWALPPIAPVPTLAVENASGDTELVEHLKEGI